MQKRSNKRRKKSQQLDDEFYILKESLHFQVRDSPIPKYLYFRITYLVS